MMADWREWSRALALMWLLTVCWRSPAAASGPCGPATPGAESPGAESAIVDLLKAQHSQRQHLEALFHRYGENGTLSLTGLKRLLESMGLDHIRNVTVQHHGEEDMDHAHHDHHHDNSTHRQKRAVSVPRTLLETSKEQDATLKRLEMLTSHDNLNKNQPTETDSYPLAMDTIRRRRRGVNKDVSQGSKTDANTSEIPTRTPVVGKEGSHNDSHGNDYDSHGHGHSHDDGHGHSHDGGHGHSHDDGHGHSHDGGHGHSHDGGHGHSHDDGHGHSHDGGHGHSHDDGHGHSHDDGHGHSHDDGHGHSHDDGHGHSHDDGHGHSHDDGHGHSHDGGHGHSHDGHGHSHDDGHGHSHDGGHGHSHDGGHGHSHDGGHGHSHDGGHGHSHDDGHGHSHDGGHGHSHEGGHSHDQGHGHSHDDGHGHSHDDGHGHSHDQGHGHSHDDGHGHSHDDGHGHSHDQGHGHSHDDGHGHSHDDGHGHSHDQGHGHSHDDGHGHSHDGHGHSHDDGHGHSHDDGHGHSHDDGHGHSHDGHGHSHDGGHGHSHDGGHGHSHDGHGHSHDQGHGHSHDDGHGHSHDGHGHGHSHDHGHGHSHDGRHGHSHDDVQESEECLGASAILSSHGMSEDAVLTVGDFSYICPALLRQMDSRSCVQHGGKGLSHDNHGHSHGDGHGHSHGDGHSGHSHGSDSEASRSRSATVAWVGGFIAVTVISLPSLMGIIIIPLMNKTFFKFLISFLVALAVGSLSGDAFLHLIPHSQGGHSHSHSHSHSHAHSHHHDESEELRGIWLGLTALAGVYFMFLTEHFITLGKMYKDKRQRSHSKGDLDNQLALENNTKPVKDVENKGTSGDHVSGGNMAEEEQVMLAPIVAVVTPQEAEEGTFTGDECENKCHSHFHDTVAKADPKHHHHHDYHHILHHHHSQNHHPHAHPHSHSHSHTEQDLKGAGIATLAWMVIMGDGLHNFSDGLAIGAAFTESLSSGLSTSLAVFCHELPHELGDFAVLLKAGMTVRQAVIYNLLSSLTAYLGLITGILIGQYADDIATWIFALTAGLFLYVALVDMVPEMLHNNEGNHGSSHWGFFLLQNAGMLLGFGIMLLIAIYEHSIHLDLGY